MEGIRLYVYLLIGSLIARCNALRPFDRPGYVGRGDGTYFGGDEYGGACRLGGERKKLPGNYIGVAVNGRNHGGQFPESMCGSCLTIHGDGVGLGGDPIEGTIEGFVYDVCPECGEGSVDLGSWGDGRWNIWWTVHPCEFPSFGFAFEGSNPWYAKMQPRGLPGPVKSASIEGKSITRQGNYWVYSPGVKIRLPINLLVTVHSDDCAGCENEYLFKVNSIKANGETSDFSASKIC